MVTPEWKCVQLEVLRSPVRVSVHKCSIRNPQRHGMVGGSCAYRPHSGVKERPS